MSTSGLKISINSMENDAFSGNAQAETARILRELATKIERGHVVGQIFDINGNKVGS